MYNDRTKLNTSAKKMQEHPEKLTYDKRTETNVTCDNFYAGVSTNNEEHNASLGKIMSTVDRSNIQSDDRIKKKISQPSITASNERNGRNEGSNGLTSGGEVDDNRVLNSSNRPTVESGKYIPGKDLQETSVPTKRIDERFVKKFHRKSLVKPCEKCSGVCSCNRAIKESRLKGQNVNVVEKNEAIDTIPNLTNDRVGGQIWHIPVRLDRTKIQINLLDRAKRKQDFRERSARTKRNKENIDDDVTVTRKTIDTGEIVESELRTREENVARVNPESHCKNNQSIALNEGTNPRVDSPRIRRKKRRKEERIKGKFREFFGDLISLSEEEQENDFFKLGKPRKRNSNDSSDSGVCPEDSHCENKILEDIREPTIDNVIGANTYSKNDQLESTSTIVNANPIPVAVSEKNVPADEWQTRDNDLPARENHNSRESEKKEDSEVAGEKLHRSPVEGVACVSKDIISDAKNILDVKDDSKRMKEDKERRYCVPRDRVSSECLREAKCQPRNGDSSFEEVVISVPGNDDAHSVYSDSTVIVIKSATELDSDESVSMYSDLTTTNSSDEELTIDETSDMQSPRSIVQKNSLNDLIENLIKKALTENVSSKESDRKKGTANVDGISENLIKKALTENVSSKESDRKKGAGNVEGISENLIKKALTENVSSKESDRKKGTGNVEGISENLIKKTLIENVSSKESDRIKSAGNVDEISENLIKKALTENVSSKESDRKKGTGNVEGISENLIKKTLTENVSSKESDRKKGTGNVEGISENLIKKTLIENVLSKELDRKKGTANVEGISENLIKKTFIENVSSKESDRKKGTGNVEEISETCVDGNMTIVDNRVREIPQLDSNQNVLEKGEILADESVSRYNGNEAVDNDAAKHVEGKRKREVQKGPSKGRLRVLTSAELGAKWSPIPGNEIVKSINPLTTVPEKLLSENTTTTTITMTTITTTTTTTTAPTSSFTALSSTVSPNVGTIPSPVSAPPLIESAASDASKTAENAEEMDNLMLRLAMTIISIRRNLIDQKKHAKLPKFAALRKSFKGYISYLRLDVYHLGKLLNMTDIKKVVQFIVYKIKTIRLKVPGLKIEELYNYLAYPSVSQRQSSQRKKVPKKTNHNANANNVGPSTNNTSTFTSYVHVNVPLNSYMNHQQNPTVDPQWSGSQNQSLSFVAGLQKKKAVNNPTMVQEAQGNIGSSATVKPITTVPQFPATIYMNPIICTRPVEPETLKRLQDFCTSTPDNAITIGGTNLKFSKPTHETPGYVPRGLPVNTNLQTTEISGINTGQNVWYAVPSQMITQTTNFYQGYGQLGTQPIPSNQERYNLSNNYQERLKYPQQKNSQSTSNVSLATKNIFQGKNQQFWPNQTVGNLNQLSTVPQQLSNESKQIRSNTSTHFGNKQSTSVSTVNIPKNCMLPQKVVKTGTQESHCSVETKNSLNNSTPRILFTNWSAFTQIQKMILVEQLDFCLSDKSMPVQESLELERSIRIYRNLLVQFHKALRYEVLKIRRQSSTQLEEKCVQSKIENKTDVRLAENQTRKPEVTEWGKKKVSDCSLSEKLKNNSSKTEDKVLHLSTGQTQPVPIIVQVLILDSKAPDSSQVIEPTEMSMQTCENKRQNEQAKNLMQSQEVQKSTDSLSKDSGDIPRIPLVEDLRNSDSTIATNIPLRSEERKTLQREKEKIVESEKPVEKPKTCASSTKSEELTVDEKDTADVAVFVDDGMQFTIPNIVDVRSLFPETFDEMAIDKPKKRNDEEVFFNVMEENTPCMRCKRLKSAVACAICFDVSYCSKRCQELHWKSEHYKCCRDISDVKSPTVTFTL